MQIVIARNNDRWKEKKKRKKGPWRMNAYVRHFLNVSLVLLSCVDDIASFRGGTDCKVHTVHSGYALVADILHLSSHPFFSLNATARRRPYFLLIRVVQWMELPRERNTRDTCISRIERTRVRSTEFYLSSQTTFTPVPKSLANLSW